jgi:hypothetical protein
LIVAGARIMATVAVVRGVDKVAAQAYQGPVLPVEIQRNRRDLESNLNSGIIIIVVIIVTVIVVIFGAQLP